MDCINRPSDLINKAIELGLSGICITDHECLSAHVEVNKIAENLKESNPNFKIGLGNEIYLIDKRGMNQKYYHFILIAKDSIGHKALRELSSTAWYYSYMDRGLERVPLEKNELTSIVKKYPGHLIATTACIGGELSTLALNMVKAEEANDMPLVKECHSKIVAFVKYCLDLFGDDFYIECAPSDVKEQIIVNKKLQKIAKAFNVKMVIGTDSHYLTPEEREYHKSYLNSKEGDREVDSFYKYTYLMDSNEVEYLLSFSFDLDFIHTLMDNSLELQDKIEFYSLYKKQTIPKVEVKDYPKQESDILFKKNYPNLSNMKVSDDIQDRYWVNQCLDKLIELNKYNETYLKELEEEARVKTIIGGKLDTNMFRYPNTLQHYIDMIWECGSMVAPGRGSSCAALNHYLMDITQLDPIEWDFPFFRYMNEERVELGDIDLDISPSKRPEILKRIKEERGKNFNKDLPDWVKENLGCTLVSTFGTEGTKSAILTACRGYRSDEYPNGIEIDEAQYMSSLIPQERGFLWPISDVVNGNEEKGRKPITTFINEVNKYPGLLNTIISIEGLVNKRSSHASGVILFDEDPFDRCSFMKTPKGELITAFDLHSVEFMGLTKYDFLVTEVQDKIIQTINFLQENNKIEKDLTLRQVYNKYLHPGVLPLDDEKIWDALDNASVINTFQFDSPVGIQAAKTLKPRNILEMSDANGSAIGPYTLFL